MPAPCDVRDRQGRDVELPADWLTAYLDNGQGLEFPEETENAIEYVAAKAVSQLRLLRLRLSPISRLTLRTSCHGGRRAAFARRKTSKGTSGIRDRTKGTGGTTTTWCCSTRRSRRMPPGC
jgi:hypothetical protein